MPHRASRPCVRRLLLVLALPAVAAAPLPAQETFFAILEGTQEVPPTVTGASGAATFVLEAGEPALTIAIVLDGLDLDGFRTPVDPSDDVTGIHLHRAPAGNNGVAVFGIIAPFSDQDLDFEIDAAAGTVSVTWDGTEGLMTTLASELAALRAGGLYLNVHTTTYPGGEIRGQLIPILFEDGFESGTVAAWSASVP